MLKDRVRQSFAPVRRDRKPLIERILACRSAFTINELMIAAAVIGIIASITVPTLLADTNKKRYKVASDKVSLSITNALKAMIVDGSLTGNETTEKFVKEFKKHMNINKICSSNNLEECFTPEFKVYNEDKELSDYTKATDLGKEWDTNLNGAILNNGTRMLIAYNPYCSKFAPSSCVAILYDTKQTGHSEYNGVNGSTDMGGYNIGLSYPND